MKKLLFLACMLLSLGLQAQWLKTSYLDYTLDTARNCADLKSDSTRIYAATDKGLLVSADNGQTWTNVTFPNTVTKGHDDSKCIALVNNGSSTLLLLGTTYGIFSSSNQGGTWAQKSTGIDTGTTVTAIVQKGTKLVASTRTKSGRGNAFVSADYGNTWDSSNTGLGSSTAFCLLVDGNSIYLGAGDGVYKSTDDGASWTKQSNGLPPNAYIFKLVKTGATLMAGSASGQAVYKSTNNALSWDSARTGLPTSFCQVFSMLSVNNVTYLCQSGAPAGQPVYKSGDEGLSWVPDTSGLPEGFYPLLGQTPGKILLFKANTGELYTKTISVGLGAGTSLEEFNLYPNPAHDVLNIESIATPGAQVTTGITDLAGKGIINGSGTRVDIGALPNGMYLLWIQAGNRTERKLFVKY